MKKLGQFLFAMMSMVLFFGMAPMTVRAESSSVYVGGTWLELDTYYKTDANGHVTTDGASATDYNVFITKNGTGKILTLNNATINGVAGNNNGTGIDCAGSTPVEIKLQGHNTVTAATAEGYYSYGIEASEQLTISGTDADKLTVVADVYDSRTNKEFSSYGIYVWDNMVIQGGTIEVYAGKAEGVTGIYVSNDLIVNGGNTTVTAGTATVYASHGIYARGENMKVTGGTLSSTGGDASDSSSYGIRTDENMEITGGTVIATGKSCAAGNSASGLYVKGTLKVENAEIVANGGTGSSSLGLFVFGDLNVTKSKITASAQEATGNRSLGILVQSGGGVIAYMEVKESTIIATAKAAPSQSAGIWVDYGFTMTDSNITATAGNADRTCALYAGESLSIQDSIVNATAGDGDISCGIGAYDYLTISQTEGKTTSVTAQGGNATDGSSYGIGVENGSITISGGTVKAYAKSSNDDTLTLAAYTEGNSYGIGAEYNITISGGNITASAYTSNTDSALFHSFGIGANNTITISGGTITANGGVAITGNSYGIGTYGDFEVSGTPVIVVKGGESIENNSFGMGIAHDPSSEYPDSSGNVNITGGNLTVAGGEITAEGGKAHQKSFGIAATDNGTIAGKLTAIGGTGTEGSCGLYTGGDLLVEENGVVSGTAGDSKESVGIGVRGTNGIMVDGGTLTGTAGNSTGTDKDSMGVASSGTIYVENDGSLTGTGGDSSSGRSLGVASDTELNVDGSTLTGQGGSAGTDSLGVSAANGITYKNSEINASGGTAGGNSYGTASEGNISFEGGSVNVSGGTSTNGISYGAGAYGTISLKDTDLTGFGNNGALGGANGFTNNNTNEFKLFVSTSNTDSSEWNGQDSIGQYKYARNTNEFYTVTFMAGEGSGTMNSMTAPKDGKITLPDNEFTAPANKEFACWKIDNTEYEVGDTYTVSANITVTAQWKFVTHVVTYMVDGEEYATVDVEHGSDVPTENIPAIPTKEGYTQTAPTWDDAGENITADRIINAVYYINKYTVTYKADGATVKTVTVEHGANVSANDVPVIPSKTGYDQTAPAWDDAGENITTDRTINAVYTINKYTVTYKADGQVVDTVEVAHGADVAAGDIPAVPSKTGYDQTEPVWDDAGENITADRIINAVYYINKYTVTYKADGQVIDTVEVVHGSNVAATDVPAVPTKTGYDQTAPTWDNDGKNIIADRTINAVYTINKYTVTYKVDGTTVKTVTVEHGSNVATTDVPTIPTKTGYTQTAPAWDDAGENITADRTINAVYTINKYTVTYKADGATVKTVTVEHGANVSANDVPAIPSKTGYTQIAPSWDNDGSNVTADRTINAVYTINKYTVTYKVDGTTVKTVTVEHGSNVATTDVPTIPTKTGYTQTAPAWDDAGENITADRIINAVYYINKYTVTYKADGQVIDTVEVVHGSNVAATDVPAVPSKTGYDQVSPVWDDAGDNITADRTINAVYTINKYTVTYKVDGTTVKTVTVEHGSNVATTDVPTIPTKIGYTQTAPAWDDAGENITADRTINAVYTINKYTVTYKADGQVVDTVIVEHGSNVATTDVPTIPTKTGYDQTAPTWDNDGKNITADRTINAVYTANIYTITYAANGGTGEMTDATATEGVAFTLPANGFTAPADQKFKAWSIGGTEYAPGATYNFTADTTVTAVWVDLDKYTVLYDANGGTGAMDSAVVTIGTVYTLENNGFTAPENQKFKAWQIGDDLYAEGAQITVTADVVVKALWEDITYVVTYDANGGTGTMADAVATRGKEFTLPTCGFTAAEGMQFKAWSIGGTEYEAGAKVLFTANTTVAAVWEEIPFDYQMTSIVPPVFEGTGTVVATSNGEFSKFQKVEVDGKELRKDVDYTAVSGSTIVTLQEAYLKTLEVGQHEVKIIFMDGEVSGYFAVKEEVKPTATPTPTPEPTQKPEDAPAPTQAPTAAPTPTPEYISPKTGADSVGMLAAIMLMLVAAGGMVVCARKKN